MVHQEAPQRQGARSIQVRNLLVGCCARCHQRRNEPGGGGGGGARVQAWGQGARSLAR